jgi:hypothetical protein
MRSGLRSTLTIYPASRRALVVVGVTKSCRSAAYVPNKEGCKKDGTYRLIDVPVVCLKLSVHYLNLVVPGSI